MIFAKSPRCDTFTTKCAAVKFAKPWMSNHFSSESTDPSYVGLTMWPESSRKDCRGMSSWLHQRESVPEVVQGPGGVITPPKLPSSVLVWIHQNYQRLKKREVFRVLRAAASETLSRWKGYKNEWMHWWILKICFFRVSSSKEKILRQFYFYIFYDCCWTQPFHKRLKKHEVVWKQSGRCKLLFLSTDSKIATFIVSKLFHLLLGFRKI